MKIQIILILLFYQIVYSQEKTCYYVKNLDLFYVISFDENNSVLTESDLKLERVFNGLLEYPNMTLEILGHCDFNEKNKDKLSMKRSLIVIDFLVKKGINRKRLKAKGFSDKKLITNCNTINCNEEKKSQNRRVEFIITTI
jgi:outer membrane protein OmpA-like peptidoglycan-associated protein